MQFPVNGRKATEAVARIIQKSGREMDYLRVVKLVYLADRKSLAKRGIPIVGGKYFSMRKGPVNGDVMNFVTRRNAPGWKDSIAPMQGHSLSVVSEPSYDSLSESELGILDEVVEEHLANTTDELVEWCHKNCEEYEEVSANGRKPISVESILQAEGKTSAAIARILKEAESLTRLDQVLA
jgi:uncharacterized phage-associated protein